MTRYYNLESTLRIGSKGYIEVWVGENHWLSTSTHGHRLDDDKLDLKENIQDQKPWSSCEIKMARSPIRNRRRKLMKLLLLQQIATTMLVLLCGFYYFVIGLSHRYKMLEIKTKEEKRKERKKWMFNLTMASDAVCISELRMNRATFRLLCNMVTEIGGLKPTKNTSVEEVVAMFVYTLAHHNKSRTISLLFFRSRETVSRQFHQVLLAILKLHHILLKKPDPITQNCQDDRWKYFQGCLGALDGTLIKVTPPSGEKPRYRTRKGCISTNVLGVCCPNMQFIYVLPGWEGSAHDGRVLRDAVSRPQGLKVPRGNYYLVDSGYCNANGFLAPYRGQRYHLPEFDNYTPETAEECFNHKHAQEVRKRMLKKIPSFDKDVNPHIDSRIKYLKNKYNPISEMLMQSGCQWDDVEHKINCEKQWYEDWCKNHKNAVGLWNFRFPYLKKLDLVWGRDRATGLKAEDISQACEDTNDKNNEFLCFSSESEDEVVMVSNGQRSPPSSNTTDTSKKKRKKVSPKSQSSHNKKKQVTTQETLDARLDNFASDFKSICGEMVSQIGVAAGALTVDANKSDCVSDEKMQEVLTLE